jgi:hypothetical protein
MTEARAARLTPRPTRRRVRRRWDWAGFARAAWRRSKRAFHAWQRARMPVRMVVAAAVLLVLWAIVNLAYHVIRKPTELFYPVSGTLTKPPAETWRQYGSLFRAYSTPIVTAEALAALAQIESAGDPVARTYWRWRFSWNPLSLYQPASSAVGMYQMTDPAFAEARNFCIRHHSVVESGVWSCWLSGPYWRIIPSHAVELTAIYLDRKAAGLIERHHLIGATPQQKQNLTALVHLCGAGPAEIYARNGFHLAPGARCGDHDAADYLARFNTAKREFLRLAAAE